MEIILLNQMLGLTGSFTHGKPCRICSPPIELIKSLTKGDKHLLRNENTYNLDCAKKNPKDTGLKETCVFHNIEDFRIWINIVLDIMHDIY